MQMISSLRHGMASKGITSQGLARNIEGIVRLLSACAPVGESVGLAGSSLGRLISASEALLRLKGTMKSCWKMP